MSMTKGEALKKIEELVKNNHHSDSELLAEITTMDYDGDIEELMDYANRKLKEKRKENPYIAVDDKGKSKLERAKLTKALLQDITFRTYRDTEEVLVYLDGYYQPDGEKHIKAECQRRVGLSAVLTEHEINEIIGHIRRSTYTDREAFNQDKITINLINGLLNTETKELRPHSPEFLSTVRIPVKYNPDAYARRAMEFMEEVHHREDIPVIQELFGNCLVPDKSIQKAILYVGDGENGKSKELSLLRIFIGKANCSSVSWQQLELNRFAKSSLEGKLANIFADLPSQSMNMTTSFKMLTGEDAIGTEKKFKDEYSFENFAKLIFSANKPPKVTDEDSYAFWRRWIIIEFPNQFTDENGKKDPDLLEKLTTEDELSGLLNCALEGLARLRQQKKYSYKKTVDETTDFYMRASDPVYAFLQDKCEADSSPNHYEDKDKFHEIFEKYCKGHKIPSLKPNAFARALLNQSYIRVKSCRPTITDEKGKSHRITAWEGVKVRADEKETGTNDE